MRRSATIQIVALLVALVAMLGQKFGLLPFKIAFPLFGLALLLVVVLGIAGLLIFVVRLLSSSSEPRGIAGRVALVGALPLLAIGFIVGPGLSAPPIHDITTDIANPPAFVAAAAARGADQNSTDYAGEKIASLQQAAFPDLSSIESELSADEAFARGLAIVEELGWTLLDQDSASGRIEAYEETSLFGFIDDVVIRVAANGEGSVIDLRSNSRVGEGDLGANEARIQRFISAF